MDQNWLTATRVGALKSSTSPTSRRALRRNLGITRRTRVRKECAGAVCAAMPVFQPLQVDCEVGQRLDAPPKDRTPTQQEIKHHVFTDTRDVDIGAESASSFCGRQSSRNSWSGVRPLQHTNHADDMSPKQRGEAEKLKGSRSRDPGGRERFVTSDTSTARSSTSTHKVDHTTTVEQNTNQP